MPYILDHIRDDKRLVIAAAIELATKMKTKAQTQRLSGSSLSSKIEDPTNGTAPIKARQAVFKLIKSL